MKISIVEPSKNYAELIASLLSGPDVETTTAHSGQQAIHIVQNDSPDALCIAHELGDMNSIEFLKQLKNLNLCQDIPKFLISSENSEDFRKKSYDAGFTDVFSKNDITVLQRALKNMMLHVSYHSNARILYVEDVPSTAAYTMSIISKVGWEVVHTDTAEKALEFLQKEQFDLVITDLILPGKISGMNLICEIREKYSDRECPLPVLALSGWNDLLRQVFVLQQGASDFISKPFQETDFIARALNLIQTKKSMDSSLLEKQALHSQALTDKLTGLYNRHAFDNNADKLIKRTFYQKLSLSVLLLDVDHFKQVNDIHGHLVGDNVLSDMGSIIIKSCRENDMAIRFGGEEFIILFPGCNKEDALIKAERLRSDIELMAPGNISVTTSIGVTSINKGKKATLDTLLKTADKALYQAKQGGRNQVRFVNMY